MAVRWVGVGPELLVGLDRDAEEPLGQQLQRQLREAVRTGRLAIDERLPSSRVLAAQVGLSRGLVVDCYEQLCAEGYLISAAGSGTRVAPGVAAGTAARRGRRTKLPPPPRIPPVEVDFEYGIPDLASFPLQDWLWSLSEAAREVSTSLMGDEPDAGSRRLREVTAAYHRRVRAGVAELDDVVVVGGFRQGLNLVFGMLAHQGHGSVGLEDPGPREHDQIAARFGLKPVPVPVDGEGLDVTALATSGTRAVLLTPAHQCPTGVTLSARRRQELAAWAEEVDAVIIEDDYDAEFRYDRQPVGSLQGLAPDRVLALGSVSKTIAPGLRIGWILAPPHLVEPLVAEKHLASRGVPALDQLALARMIESGRFDRHLRRMRKMYAARRKTLTDELTRCLPHLRLDGLEAGCHALLRLPARLAEDDIVARAAARSVRVYGLGRYRLRQAGKTHDHHPPALVLGFGNVNESKIQRGLRILSEVIQESRSVRHPRAVGAAACLLH